MSDSNPNSAGLPPVAPPSGRFIAQLFLVPGLIVLAVVLLVLGVNYLLVGERTAEYFLSKLDSDNLDIRWRGASDLAQVLKRKEPGSMLLKTDVNFALDLAERLERSLADLKVREKEIAALPAEDQKKGWRKIRVYRDHLLFLLGTMADFPMPIGIPLIGEIAERDDSLDVFGNTLRRRQAVWVLGALGQQVKSFPSLSEEQRKKILGELLANAQSEKSSNNRKLWARNAIYYLEPFNENQNVVKVDSILAKCSKAKDRFLREQVAFALNFWDGDLVEPTLLQLSRDDGSGDLILIAEND